MNIFRAINANRIKSVNLNAIFTIILIFYIFFFRTKTRRRYLFGAVFLFVWLVSELCSLFQHDQSWRYISYWQTPYATISFRMNTYNCSHQDENFAFKLYVCMGTLSDVRFFFFHLFVNRTCYKQAGASALNLAGVLEIYRRCCVISSVISNCFITIVYTNTSRSSNP